MELLLRFFADLPERAQRECLRLLNGEARK